jgi:hypothetical protein
MSFITSSIDIPQRLKYKGSTASAYLQNNLLCCYSCPSAQQRNDVLLLPCSPEQYAKSLSNPLYANLYSTPTPQKRDTDSSQNSLVDYMKCYMSSSSDEDNDVFQYSDDDTHCPHLPKQEYSRSISQQQSNTEEQYDDEEEEYEFDGVFSVNCPITAKICENVALSLLQNNE